MTFLGGREGTELVENRVTGGSSVRGALRWEGRKKEKCPPHSTEHLQEVRAGVGGRATGTGEREEADPTCS